MLDIYESHTEHIEGGPPMYLCVLASGTMILEQILFAKMQLFSSLYHHQKVRVAHQAVLRLLEYLRAAKSSIRGMSLDSPETFIALEDADVLHGCWTMPTEQCEPLKNASELAKAIRNRALPMRALVLTYPVWGPDKANPDDSYREDWASLMKGSDQPDKLESQIAEATNIQPEQVWVDIPDIVNLQGTGQEGLIKFDDKTALPIQTMFPIGGWGSAYQSYRMVSYIFTSGDRAKVGKAAKAILEEEYSIVLNDVALKLARID